MKPGAHHPLLSLTPQARRQLARTLVQGLDLHRQSERQVRAREGAVGTGLYGTVGAGLFAAWHVATGGDFAPFAAWYAGWGLIQGMVGGTLDRVGTPLGPLPVRRLALAPYAMARAVQAWLLPERLTPDRLVLAAGLLVAIRRPTSYHLVRRLYARAYPQHEVDKALSLLVHLGFVTRGVPAGPTPGAGPGVLHLTTNGLQMLRTLEVPGPRPRPQREPAVAPHLVPIFVLLDRKARQTPAIPEAPMPVRPAAPPVVTELPFPRATVVRPIEAPPVEVPIEPVRPVAPPVVVRPAKPLPWGQLAIAAAAALAAGLLLLLTPNRWLPTPSQGTVELTASLMPGNSQGMALQFNGGGELLSSFGGGLYLSVPERLDFKRPVSFKGFDMASECGLISRPVRKASLSPGGRFMWSEMGGDATSGPRERCLVDNGTKTVTHDLVGHHAAYGLPGLVGWANEQQLLMSEELNPRQADKWWLLDVTHHRAVTIRLPHHGRVLPLATDAGASLLLGADMRGQGAWDLTTYWLDETHTYQKARTIRASFPEGMQDAEPRHAALSPDRRYVLLTLKPVGVEVPAGDGALLVVRLEDGDVTTLPQHTTPLPDAPIFWGPEVAGGHYRFYFNGTGPDGVVPYAGEMTVSKP